MGWIGEAVLTSIAAFAATNIDDIVILTLLFAQVNATFRPHHIIAGQYLGFVVLILLSLPGFLGGLLISKEWLGLLGVLPIAIGISQLLNRENDDEIQTVTWVTDSIPRRSRLSTLSSVLTPQTYNVAAVTLANGGDNIGIYIPLFANSDLLTLGITLGVFLGLVAVWCYGAYQLTQFPAIAHVLTRYANTIVPFVLIGLGGFILLESKTHRLLNQFPDQLSSALSWII